MSSAAHMGEIGSALAPSGTLVALGFGLTRFRRLAEIAFLAPLVTDLATPCLVFTVFARMQLNPAAIASLALAAGLCILVFALVSTLLLWGAGLRVRTYLGPLSFPNTGNLGIPVAAAAFGAVGIAYATVFYAVSSLANCVFGQALAAGSVNWRRLGRIPLIYAAFSGLLVSLVQPPLPAFLRTAAEMVGQMAIPAMLLMLGSALATLRLESAPRALGLGVFRLAMGAAVGWAVAHGLGLRGTVSSVLIIQAAMPVAINSYLFAQRWGCEPEEVAAMVAASTAGACATIPLILVYLNV